MPQQIPARELRRVAAYVEETSLDALATYADISYPLVSGGLKDFPRESSEARTVERGFQLLREDTERVVSSLYALSTIGDDIEVPAALLASLQPYVDAYNSERANLDREERTP